MTHELDETAAGKTTARERNALAPGVQLGKYTLERMLGAGGMGVVWCAHDPDLERSVAIKLLHAPNALPEQRARLLREARAMARLKHPNVLTVYEVDSDGDRDFIAMELVDGSSLDGWLAIKPPEGEIWQAVIAAGRGLAAAHAAGLVHRDFKPHNVLRSRDGRVLVTDFGLARGLGDGEATAAAKPPPPVDPEPSHIPVALDLTLEATPGGGKLPSKNSGVLDSTLTQPGALIGTPAYMAPEQYYGAPPDPRTDQFAFCVSAWQALTGERPFKGESLDELRTASAAGVAGVPARLPRAIRAVLARGLSVDPAERWPDLDALLDALERARDQPRRRRAAFFITFGLVMAVVLFVAARQRGLNMPAANPNGCEPPEHAFEPWTQERRAAFEKRLGSHPNAIALADALDAFRAAWLHRYRDACAAAPGPKVTARINCLLGERDDLDGLARMCDTLPANAIAGLELWGLVPALEACDGESPIAPPLLPEDRKVRDQIVALRSQIAALRMDPTRLLQREDELVGYAKHLGWKPLVPELEVAVGTAAQLIGDFDKARVRLDAAADEAVRLADFRVEAMARIGLLEVELSASADPSDRSRIAKLIDQANDVVQRAGGDPALAMSVEELRAQSEVARGDLTAAIDRLETVRTKLLASHAYRPATVATIQELDALLQRGQAGDLELAWKRGLDTEHGLVASGRPVSRRLAAKLVDVAWQRDDLDQVHARADKLESTASVGEQSTLTGHVVGPDGAVVAGARVVAWTGELDGDSARVDTTVDFAGAVTTTDARGDFSVLAPKAGAIIAEHGGLRSEPMLYGAGPAVVKLAATHAIRGHVDAVDAMGVNAFVRIEVGKHAWKVRAPVAPDRAFEIAGLTGGTATAGLEGVGPRRGYKDIFAGSPRDGMTIAWPNGPTLDVIVRGAPLPRTSQTQVAVIRGHVAMKTEDDIFKHSRSDDALGVATAIGFENTTREGQASYARGDLHAVFQDNAPGEVTVCAVYEGGGTTAPACAVTTITAKTGTVVVVLAR